LDPWRASFQTRKNEVAQVTELPIEMISNEQTKAMEKSEEFGSKFRGLAW
jgi:hypothetical protein